MVGRKWGRGRAELARLGVQRGGVGDRNGGPTSTPPSSSSSPTSSSPSSCEPPRTQRVERGSGGGVRPLPTRSRQHGRGYPAARAAGEAGHAVPVGCAAGVLPLRRVSTRLPPGRYLVRPLSRPECPPRGPAGHTRLPPVFPLIRRPPPGQEHVGAHLDPRFCQRQREPARRGERRAARFGPDARDWRR